MSDNEPLFSRTGRTSPLGKLSAKISEFRVHESTKDILQARANQAGMPLGEYIRDRLTIDAHGEDMYRSLHESRLDLVLGMSDKCHG